MRSRDARQGTSSDDRGRRDRLRCPSDGAEPRCSGALYERSLAGHDPDARHRRTGLDQLPGQFADYRARRLAAGQGQACRRRWSKCARECLDPFRTSIAICNCLYGAQLLFSEDMATAFASAVNDWIANGVAGARAATARQHRRADPERRDGGRGNRALRQKSALRAGAVAGERRSSARQTSLLADLCRCRAPRPDDRHSRRQQLSQSADRGRLAELLHRRLCRAGAGVPDPDHQHDLRRRVLKLSDLESGAAGIRDGPGCRRICGA